MFSTDRFKPIAPTLPIVWALSTVGVLASAGPAFAGGAPVAIVEEVGDGVTQVEPMDLLSEGDHIELAPSQSVIIGYFATCMREVVHGGKVTIGKSGSKVEGGQVETKTMKCAAGTMDLTPEQLAQSAALAYRDPTDTDPLRPQFTLNSTQPVIFAPDLQEITLEDSRPKDPVTGEIGKPTMQTIKLDADGVADFAMLGITLRPGDVYVLKGGKRALCFKVDAFAVAAPLPILVRLIRL
jgi:hypothetical protein